MATITTITSLDILYAASVGDIEKERIVLKVSQKIDLSNYIIVNGKKTDEGLYDLNDKLYWFPSKIVGPGSLVRLYTKVGTNKSFEGKFKEQPTMFHDFFWGLSESVWHGDSNSAVIVRVQDWRYQKVV